MVIALTFSALTRNHLQEYLFVDAFSQLRSTDFEGAANIRSPLAQGMRYSSEVDPRTWNDLQKSTDPVKQEYFKIRLQKAVAYQVVSNALRNDNILNALQNDVVFPTQLKYREGRAASIEIHRNRFTIPKTKGLSFPHDKVRFSMELKDEGQVQPHRAADMTPECGATWRSRRTQLNRLTSRAG
jgi:hypothetical protein